MEKQFYLNEKSLYADGPPSREYVVSRIADLMPDLIEKVINGRDLSHPLGIITALRDQMVSVSNEGTGDPVSVYVAQPLQVLLAEQVPLAKAAE